jgi:release factor glutamine methyltransferase
MLQDSDGDNSRRAARILLAEVLGVSQEHLVARPEEQLSDQSLTSYLTLLERRAGGEPLQYLTGKQEFYGLEFLVTTAVLIPRPESEIIVDRVRSMADLLPDPFTVVDMGTGSGCIAVALAVQFPSARVIATDISEPALAIARGNAERHGVAGRVEFLQGDGLAALDQTASRADVDILVGNPPYVPSGDDSLLQRQVRDHEPAVALFGGPDGLDFYRRLLLDAPAYLKSGSYCVLEIGYRQLSKLREIIAETDLEIIEVTDDLQGLPRTITLKIQ